MKKITKLLLALMFITSMHETHAQVCTFPGAECCGEGITNFQLNGTPAINRTSTVNENGGFTNTGLTTTVVSGQTYNFSVTFPLENNIVNCNTYNFKIYIDYNQNNLLTDAGEEAVSLANVETGTQTGSFTIPTTALIGNAYMRVMMKMAFASLSGGSCG
ncbi:MAG TPA: GEVED domain-containing protein, partial [Bacteroidia bacterium]|nr:GEVED domain-containing protein [Bacteroidia bacterium]